MSLYYTLDDSGNPQPIEDVLAWAKSMGDRRSNQIGKEENEDWLLSTVFLGTDMGFGNVPLLFETMYFTKKDGKVDFSGEAQERYSTRKEAIDGHERYAKLLGFREPPKLPDRDEAPMPGPRKVKL